MRAAVAVSVTLAQRQLFMAPPPSPRSVGRQAPLLVHPEANVYVQPFAEQYVVAYPVQTGRTTAKLISSTTPLLLLVASLASAGAIVTASVRGQRASSKTPALPKSFQSRLGCKYEIRSFEVQNSRELELTNLLGLVLGCIEAKFCKKICV